MPSANMNTLTRFTSRLSAAATNKLTNIALSSLKLTFGLSSLAAVWINAVIIDGALWAWDSAEYKQELAAGKFSTYTRVQIHSLITV